VFMNKRNIVVIGASAGGFEALKKLVSVLPKDLDASIFIVWHMSPDVRGVLPQVLNKQETLFAINAVDMEPIKTNRIYVAPPDHHLLLEEGRMRVTRGPRENRFRPAIDPLFRSAAYTYGTRVIGIILSGALDDGSAGLWNVKEYGGMAIVQDPLDAEVPSMPEHAIKSVRVDHVVSVSEMGGLLSRLTQETVQALQENGVPKNELTKKEIEIAMENPHQIKEFGELTPYTCPECHGVLSALKEGDRVRFRCHTGHAFSADSLLSAVTESIEESLWGAIRSIQESIMLLNHMGDHFAESNQTQLAAKYFKKAIEAEKRSALVRQAVYSHENLTELTVTTERGAENLM
jgi:two-component system chemotaxis response regulator CheB